MLMLLHGFAELISYAWQRFISSLIFLSIVSASSTSRSTFTSIFADVAPTLLHSSASTGLRWSAKQLILETLPPKHEVFTSKHDTLAPKHEELAFKAPLVPQDMLWVDKSHLEFCCTGACRFDAGTGRQGCGGVSGMTRPLAEIWGGGVELLTAADPPTTGAGAGPTLPRLRLGGGTAPATPGCRGLMHDGGVACWGGVFDPIEDRDDLLDLSVLKEPPGVAFCSGVAFVRSFLSVPSRPASMKRAMLSLSSAGEKGRPPLYR